MKTRQFLITLLIVFLAISSSFSQTKRFINEQYIFNVNPKSAGYDFKALDSITASDTLALINNSVLGGKWVRGRNLPVKDVDINNYSHNGTLSSYLQGIDLALGAIQETTAGVLTRIYFTGDETTITSGTYYLSNVTGKGTVSDVVQTVSNGDNTKTFFTQDIISSASLITSTAKKGSYTSNLSVSTESAGNGNDYSQRFTIEIYLTDNDGLPINSGVTGAPVGGLGVTVLTILDSGVLNMPYDAITNITLTGNLNEDVTLLAGNRIRYHISAEKIGTNGGTIDQSLYLGSDHNSYYDVPTPILWGDIEGVLSNQVDLQNALDAKANSIDVYTKTESSNKYVSISNEQIIPSSKIFTSTGTRFNRLNLVPTNITSQNSTYSGMLEEVSGKLLFFTKGTNTTNFVLDNSNLTSKRDYILPDTNGDILVSSSFIYNESLSGSINNSNTVYTTSNNFRTNTTQIYYNGVRQILGIDYSETGSNEITFTTAPTSGYLRIDYLKL